MGSTFANLQIRSSTKADVVKALTPILKAPAYVSRSNDGWVSAYPEEGNRLNLDLNALYRIAKLLSDSLRTEVFVIFDYHSDAFIFSLYASGEWIGYYDSFPEFSVFYPDDESAPKKEPYVPIDLAAVLPFCRKEVTEEDLRTCLYPDQRPVFSEYQITDFAKMLGIPDDRVFGSFKDVSRDLETARRRSVSEDQAITDFNNANNQSMETDGESEEVTLLQVENLPQEYWNKKLFDIDNIKQPDKMRLAIANGADPNARNGPEPYGTTILHTYSGYCMVEHMRILIEAGANVNSFARRSMASTYDEAIIFEQVTPLMAVASRSVYHSTCLIDAARLLIDAGAEVNARSSIGRTALTMAEYLTDWTKQTEGGIGRVGPDEVFKDAAARSAQLVELLKEAGATY